VTAKNYRKTEEERLERRPATVGVRAARVAALGINPAGLADATARKVLDGRDRDRHAGRRTGAADLGQITDARAGHPDWAVLEGASA